MPFARFGDHVQSLTDFLSLACVIMYLRKEPLYKKITTFPLFIRA